MRVNVIAHPNSKNPRVEVDLLETLHVYVREPALDGKANKAVILSLANYFKINKNSISLVSGIKSKAKLFEINK